MKLGEYQTLQIVKHVDFGVYLAERQGDEERVLLPKKQVPADSRDGDRLEVFLYKDSKNRLIATTARPKLTLGGCAPLKVASLGNIGAFLDWGLEKDLFLPYKQMTKTVAEGEELLVTLYIDKSGRLCASMRGLYHLLSKDSPYQRGEIVTGRVYEFSNNFGTFVAVDDTYSAMIPLHEDCSALHIGDKIEARVSNVKPDGKLDLTLREKISIQIELDAQSVMQVIESYGGVLPFNDKAPVDVIKREMKMSKNAFKRAVGNLYKKRKIVITDREIRKVM